MKYYIKTLTPIHIGNGEELNALDYVLHNNKFYRISQRQFIEFLQQEKIDVSLYSDWITEITNKINDLEDEKRKDKNKFGKDKNQQLSDLRKNFNLLQFVRKNEIKKEVEFINYLDNNKNVIKIFLGNKKINEKNIRGFLKNGNNKPYIPGTSIKGAIRTALLYHYLSNSKNTKELINILNKNLQNRDIKKEYFADEIENLAFYCGFQKNKNAQQKNDDEKFDILKFLTVSDGKVVTKNALTIDNLNLFLVSKDKSGNFANIQPQAPTIEAIKEDTFIEFEIDFNIDYLLTIKNNYNFTNNRVEIKVGQENEFQWIGLKEKIQNVFGIDIGKINEKNKEEFKKQILDTVILKVAKFSYKQKEWDEKWLKEITEKNTRKAFDNKNIINGFKKINGENLIHLGFGTGFIGTTEFLYFLSNIKDEFKKVMDKFLIGDKPGAQKARRQGAVYNSNPDKFPKSKRLVTRNEIILPLGWGILLSEDEKLKKEKEREVKEAEEKRKKELEKEQQKKLELEKQQREEEERRLQEEEFRKKQEREKAEIEAKRHEKQQRAKNEGLVLDNFDYKNRNAFENLKKIIERFSSDYYLKSYKNLINEMPTGILPEEYHQLVINALNLILQNLNKREQEKWLQPFEKNPVIKKLAEWVGKEKAISFLDSFNK